MLENESKIGLWQKILLMIGFISASVIVTILACMLLSAVLFSILYKLIPGKIDYTFVIAFPIFWAPILGATLGIFIGLMLFLSRIKKNKSQYRNFLANLTVGI